MQQPAARLRCCRRQYTHRGVIDGDRLRRLIFSQIHCRVGGGIDHPLGAAFRQCACDGLFIADVEFLAGPDHHVMLRMGRRNHRARDLAAAAEHQHSHANFSISAKLAPRASLGESLGATPAGRGQRMLNFASFHARVRSCSGL